MKLPESARHGSSTPPRELLEPNSRRNKYLACLGDVYFCFFGPNRRNGWPSTCDSALTQDTTVRLRSLTDAPSAPEPATIHCSSGLALPGILLHCPAPRNAGVPPNCTTKSTGLLDCSHCFASTPPRDGNAEQPAFLASTDTLPHVSPLPVLVRSSATTSSVRHTTSLRLRHFDQSPSTRLLLHEDQGRTRATCSSRRRRGRGRIPQHRRRRRRRHGFEGGQGQGQGCRAAEDAQGHA